MTPMNQAAALTSIAHSLEYFVNREKTKEAAEEKTRQESWEYQKNARLQFSGAENAPCIYCEREGRMIMRGSVIIGCTVCLGLLIKAGG